jgi:hypothetical protein
MNWLKLFDERQQKEIEFSQFYAQQFGHGTDGHNSKLIVARMAELLTNLEIIIQVPSKTSEETLSDIARSLKVIE